MRTLTEKNSLLFYSPSKYPFLGHSVQEMQFYIPVFLIRKRYLKAGGLSDQGDYRSFAAASGHAGH